MSKMASYRVIDGELQVKEGDRDWENLDDHMGREHPEHLEIGDDELRREVPNAKTLPQIS